MRRVTLADDSGAVAVMVAVLLTSLLGAAALTLDVGALYVEKRELQNGADAAALAIAQDCAADPASDGCASALTSLATARSYANGNSRDSASTVAEVRCESDLPDCRGVTIDMTAKKVTVWTDTNDPSSADTSRLAHWFAPVLGADATAVSAKGVAIWGAASLAGGGSADVPVSGSVCDFMGVYDATITPAQLDARAESLHTVESLAASMGGAITGGDTLNLHQVVPDTDDCTVSPGFSTDGGDGAGDDSTMPAGFGFLQDDGNCGVKVLETLVDGSFWAAHKAGTSPAAATCIKKAVGSAVDIPIFIEVDRANKKYLLYAPAAFYITGARVTGGGSPSVPSGFVCPGGAGDWCIRGHWVQRAAGGGSINPDAPSFGVDTYELTLD